LRKKLVYYCTMDLEKLTKHQIVLLTLLVSFVTSIATGIVTVALMDQAPTSVVRTVNQIVERTVEKVVPDTSGVAAAVVTKEKTVIVKDDDLAAQSIAKMQKAIVRIAAKGGDLLLTRGVLISQDGVALVDRGSLGGAEAYEAILPDGERVVAKLRAGSASSSIAVMDIAVGTSSVAAAAIADASKLQLGQSVIRIGGTGADTVGTGVIARMPSPETHSYLIEASVTSATPGSVLMTLFGEIIGIVTTDSLAQSAAADFYSIPAAAMLIAPAPNPST